MGTDDVNILYIGNDKPHCTERFVKYGLESHGHTVHLFPVKTLNFEESKRIYKERNCNFILFSKPSTNWFENLLKWTKFNNILTVCWQWDLYWGYRPQRPPQFYSDLLFTTDGGHDAEWAANGYNHRVLRQGISRLTYSNQPQDEYRWDVAFVGSMDFCHPGRRELVKHLTKRYGPRFNLVTNTRGAALTELLSRVKIVVGDSYPSPRYWSNRIYEMLGRAAFLIYPRTEGLDEEFTDGRCYVAFERGDFLDLDEKVARYAASPAAREAIRLQGFRTVGERYTYFHRTGDLLDVVSGFLPSAVDSLPTVRQGPRYASEDTPSNTPGS